MSELPADVVTAVCAVLILLIVAWRAFSPATGAPGVPGPPGPQGPMGPMGPPADEKSDDTDWAEKYQHLALRVAAVIDTDYQAPATYTDAATLGYRDGAKAVVTDLRATLSEGA